MPPPRRLSGSVLDDDLVRVVLVVRFPPLFTASLTALRARLMRRFPRLRTMQPGAPSIVTTDRAPKMIAVRMRRRRCNRDASKGA